MMVRPSSSSSCHSHHHQRARLMWLHDTFLFSAALFLLLASTTTSNAFVPRTTTTTTTSKLVVAFLNNNNVRISKGPSRGAAAVVYQRASSRWMSSSKQVNGDEDGDDESAEKLRVGRIQVQKERALKLFDESFGEVYEETFPSIVELDDPPNIEALADKEDYDEYYEDDDEYYEDDDDEDFPSSEPPIEALADKGNEIMKGIRVALEKGRVKPLFHAHFLPATFLEKQRSLSAVVTAGEFDETRQMKFDGFAKNLDKIFDDSDNGAGSIIDKDLGSIWDFSQEFTDFAVELVNTDAEMLGVDIESTKLTSIPIQLNSGDKSFDLMTRRECRGVVRDIFHRFAEETEIGSVSAITGSPGIGKSWTLLYALQQALLYDGATVLFFFQKVGNAVLFVRRNDKLYAWTATSRTGALSNLFKRFDVLVLLDPKEARERGADFFLGPMKLLYAASNNQEHFKNAAGKNSGMFQTFIGPPSDRELPVILRRLDPSLTQDFIEERKNKVGNLIRYFLDDRKYTDRVKATDYAVGACVKDRTILLKALKDEGMSDGRMTIPGTLFQVLPARAGRIGYEGQGVRYRERRILAVNENVRQAILEADREVVLSYLGKTTSYELAEMGIGFEKLFIDYLFNPDGIVLQRFLQPTSGKLGDVVASELVIKNGMVVREYTKKSDMEKLCGEVLMEENFMAKVPANFKLIDAAGPGRKVYQVTVKESHSMSLEAMLTICENAGYVDKNGFILPEGKCDKLEFHWVVPTEIAWKWKTKVPFKYRPSGDTGKVRSQKVFINEFLKKHVNQYVVPVTSKKPLSYSEGDAEPQDPDLTSN